MPLPYSFFTPLVIPDSFAGLVRGDSEGDVIVRIPDSPRDFIGFFDDAEKVMSFRSSHNFPLLIDKAGEVMFTVLSRSYITGGWVVEDESVLDSDVARILNRHVGGFTSRYHSDGVVDSWVNRLRRCRNSLGIGSSDEMEDLLDFIS